MTFNPSDAANYVRDTVQEGALNLMSLVQVLDAGLSAMARLYTGAHSDILVYIHQCHLRPGHNREAVQECIQ